MSDFYSAQEAMAVLKKPRSTFFKEVEEGLIPFELEDGRQRGRLYPKTAIDTLAARQKKTRKNKEYPHLSFSSSSPADMWAEIQIGTSLYGEDDVVPYDKILEWRDINDQMHMSVKENGRVVGYSCLMPIDEQILHPLIEDRIRERDIPNDTIRQWTDLRLSVYVSSLTVKPSGRVSIDRERGRFLIKQTIQWALRVNQQSDVKNWYGIGASPEGQHLFSALGFTEIASLYKGERKGYLLNDIRKAAPLIKNLLEEMKGIRRQ